MVGITGKAIYYRGSIVILHRFQMLVIVALHVTIEPGESFWDDQCRRRALPRTPYEGPDATAFAVDMPRK